MCTEKFYSEGRLVYAQSQIVSCTAHCDTLGKGEMEKGGKQVGF